MIETSQLTAALLIVADNLDQAQGNMLGAVEDVARAKLNLRNLAAHAPEPTEPATDEWVRVGVGATIPGGLRYRLESELTSSWMVGDAGFVAYVRRSDLDKLTPPDPAAKLAAALTKAGDDTWTAADVRDVLASTGLALGAEK